MLTAWYPGNKARDLMEIFKKAPKLPSYIKKWQVFASADGSNGIKVYNIIFVEEKASDEASIFIAKTQQLYIDNIEGYTWKIEPVMSMRDTMKVFS